MCIVNDAFPDMVEVAHTDLVQLCKTQGIEFKGDNSTFEHPALRGSIDEQHYKICCRETPTECGQPLNAFEGIAYAMQKPDLIQEGMSIQLEGSTHPLLLPGCYPSRYNHVAFLGRENGVLYLHWACKVYTPTPWIKIPCAAH